MNSPTTPGQKASGRKAQSVVAVDEVMGQNIRREAIRKASSGGLPSAILRSANSVMTIEPSTRRPTDRMSENSTTRLTVRPRPLRTRKAMKSDEGIATPTRAPARAPTTATSSITTRRIEETTLLPRSVSMLRICVDESFEKE